MSRTSCRMQDREVRRHEDAGLGTPTPFHGNLAKCATHPPRVCFIEDLFASIVDDNNSFVCDLRLSISNSHALNNTTLSLCSISGRIAPKTRPYVHLSPSSSSNLFTRVASMGRCPFKTRPQAALREFILAFQIDNTFIYRSASWAESVSAYADLLEETKSDRMP